MKKYKIINETDLSNEDIGSLIDIYIGRQSEETLYAGKEDKITIGFNREIYYITCKYGIRSITFIIKEGKKNA